jgi:lipoate-protein ligase A
MRTWRFLNTGVSTASLNMALDQAILATHAGGKCLPTLRVYQWNPPAISLGYFQKRHGIDLAACRRLGIDVIRRPTGGRAVMHIGDLTYSVIAGTTDGMPSSVIDAYHLICEGLLAGFRTLGFEAELRNLNTKSTRSDNCFLTSTSGDILYRGKKFVGSAQTWHGSSMLQHGSIILEPYFEMWLSVQEVNHARSVANEETLKYKMTSIKEILGRVPETGGIAATIRNGFAQVLGIEFRECELSSEELSLAGKIVTQYTEEESIQVSQPMS